MKIITLISGGDVGGAKTHVLSLISGIGSSAEVKLVCFREGEFASDARKLGIDTLVMEQNIFTCLRQLKKLIRTGGYDIIHCHGSRGNAMGMLLKRSCGIPVVTTVHSDNRLDYLGRPFGKLVYGNINRFALRRIKYHIGVSDAMTDILIGRGYKPSGIYTIYNGLDFDHEVPVVPREKFLASIGAKFPADAVIVGIAARLDPVKDLMTLISAFAKAVKNAPKLRLIIAGEGFQQKALHKSCQELGVEDKVCFAGWIDDINSFYASIDINTLTSISETFPYAITEGARMHLPTVSTRVGGVPRLIDHGINGYLIDAGGVDALAGHLTELALSPELRKTMGDRIFLKARRDFSVESTCTTQMDIYSSILRREQRKSKKRDGVILCGAYGRHNAGDDAILEAILLELRQLDADMPLWVMSRRPREIAVRYHVNTLYIFNMFRFLPRMRKTQLYINGGGSLIQDITSRRSLWFYLFTIAGAKKRGNKVQMFGCGFGPVTRRFNRGLAVRVINNNVDAITLREDNSLREMTQLGINRPRIILSADPALILPAASPESIDGMLMSCGIPVQGDYICFALRKWPQFASKVDAFAAAADYAYYKHGLIPLFLPIEPKVDVAAAKLVCERMTAPYYALETLESSGMTIGVLSRMRAVLSMRLHGLVFSSAQGVPLVGVVYDQKVSSFLDYIGQDLYVNLDAADKDKLCSLIDEAIIRGRDKETLQAAVMRLMSIEKHNIETASELLK